MSVIINPRGTGGAGKTLLVRRIMAVYERGGPRERIYREGRRRPICYRFQHPFGGRPLVVLGHYEVTSGGCDTIGSLDEVFQLVDAYAAGGHDVLFEGLEVSRDHHRSAALAEARGLHVLRLGTPLDQCIRNLITRRRARRDIRPRIAEITESRYEDVDTACGRLRQSAEVAVLDFDEALLRARKLLGVGQATIAA